MPQRHRPAYPLEFRQKLIDLARAGRTPKELATEFEPSQATITAWIKQADIDIGQRTDGLTTAEREELTRLRREVKQLRVERDIRGGSGFLDTKSGPDKWKSASYAA